MRYLVMLLPLLLAACASAIMQSYVGKDVQMVALDYGPPANIMEMGEGKRAYQWHRTNSHVIPGYSRSTTSGGGTVRVIGNTGYISRNDTTNTYTTPASIASTDCFYTLFAEQQGTQWIVTSFHPPQLSCE